MKTSPALSSAARLLLLSVGIAPVALAQSTTKLSRSNTGANANGPCYVADSSDAISPNGRFAVFSSRSTNLNPADTSWEDVFIHDRTLGTIAQVNLTASGGYPNGDCNAAVVSDDGRFVAFQAAATGLGYSDFNQGWDVYVADRQSTGLILVSRSSNTNVNQTGNGESTSPSISSDGRLVAFASVASDLVAGDTNFKMDVFVRNIQTSTTTLVSVLPSGTLSNADSNFPAISGDGGFVAFETLATNLAPGTTTTWSKVLVANLGTGAIELVSRSTLGASADYAASSPSISSDGSRIAFLSFATNLAPVITAPNAFLRERTAGTTTMVNVLTNQTQSNGTVAGVRLSNNGEFCALRSSALNLTPGHMSFEQDVFIVDLAWRLTARASVPLVEPGEPNNGGVQALGGVDDTGRFALFQCPSTNLIAGEPADTIVDVYLRESVPVWYRDLDIDGFGDGSQVTVAPFPAGGIHSLVSGDCDDLDPAVSPAEIEICNGIDDDCDSFVDELAWNGYCFAGTSTFGCTPTILATGFPSASAASGFFIEASGLPGGRQAILIYGLASDSVSFGFGSSSTLCVAPPRVRTLNKSTAGTLSACDGGYSLDWLAYMATIPTGIGQPIQAGDTFYTQVWYRDPGSVLNSNLTAGVSFSLCP